MVPGTQDAATRVTWRGVERGSAILGCLHCPTLCSTPSMCGVREEGPRAQPRGRMGERHQWCKLVCVCGGENPVSEEYQGQHMAPLDSSVCIGAQMHRRVSDRRGCPNSWGREGCLEGARPGPQLVCGNVEPMALSRWQPEGREGLGRDWKPGVALSAGGGGIWGI